MARRVMYELGGKTYNTKAEVVAECQRILKQGWVSNFDTVFLYDLVKHHPEAHQKIGCGIQQTDVNEWAFYIDSDGYGGKCFWLEREDGTRTDWSFRSCLKPPTHEQDVRQALRRAIANQVVEFRRFMFADLESLPCAITGQPVTIYESHVDHKPPHTFLTLVGLYLTERGITYKDIAVVPTEDGDTLTALVDKERERDWQEFHKQWAQLQITSARANLSQGRG